MPLKEEIKIGHLSTFYHTSFILMSTDWLEKSGIHASWKIFASGPDIVNAFAKGDIDIGYLGLPPAIIGIDRGISIICIAGGHVEGTVLIASSDYRKFSELGNSMAVLKQLEGKCVGCPPKGSIHDVIIHNMIEEAQLDIRIKNFPWADFVLEALIDKEIDAAVGTPSLAVAAARSCGASIIIPPDVLWPNNPSYGIIVRKELIEYKEKILSFIELHERACNLIRTEPQRAASMVSALTEIVNEDFVLDCYRVSPKYCASLSSGFVASSLAFIPVLHRLKYISRMVAEEEIFEYSLINTVHKEPQHYDSRLIQHL